jgi:hypothetical protein
MTTIYVEVQRQERAELTVWQNCDRLSAGHYPADDGVFRKPATVFKRATMERACMSARGFYFHGHAPCGPDFPSRFQAPFCYAPQAPYDRALFWLRLSAERVF